MTDRRSARALLAASAALFAVGLAAIPTVANAEVYPSRPIKLIVPFPPGGGPDLIARELANKVTTQQQGWTIVIDNKPGSGGNIGIDAAAKAAPDGYTLAMGQTANMAINPTLYSKLPFNPQKDLATISLVASSPLAIVVGFERLVERGIQLRDHPDLRKKLTDQGADVLGGTPEQFAKLVQEENDRWSKVVKESGAKVD